MEEICKTKNCEISHCAKRHPKSCKYFNEFSRCKFSDYCRYKHDDVASNDKIRMENMESRLSALEKENKHLKETLKEKEIMM